MHDIRCCCCCCAPPLRAIYCGADFNCMQMQQQQQQQQQLQQRSSGGDIIVHLSRDWMALFLIYYQCSVNDLVPLLLDVCMNDYIGMVAKELVFSMKSPILYRRPDKKRAITDVLARAAVDIPCVIELISPEWPVRDKPKVPDEIMEELDNTHCLQSTMGGVVLQYILHGKGVTPHHHQVRACMITVRLPRTT